MKGQEGVRPRKHRSSFWRELFRTKPVAGVCMLVLIFFVLVAVCADFIAPYPMENGQLTMNILDKLKPISLEHPLGTDALGRDLLSYLIYGARTSVILCITCTIISTVISTLIGVSSAVLGGKADLIVQRFVDAWQCIPGMLILLILMSLMGNGMLQLMVAISVPNGISGSRMVRAAAMSVKDSGYVKCPACWAAAPCGRCGST